MSPSAPPPAHVPDDGAQDSHARLHDALQAAALARQQAERAEQAKSAFLAHMSHEIRTPLNGLLGLTELALALAENPAQRRYLEVALQSGRSLLSVINNVLEMSRLDSGMAVLADEPFDLGDTLADALRAVVPLLGDKPVVSRFDVEGGPLAVRGDAARLRQIIVNLLGNAIKFTERGKITLGAVVQPTQPSGAVTLCVDVTDTGPGMTPEVAERIFEPFFQADSALTRQHEGTGLGLPIARGLARSMGGELRVASTPGQGTVFTLELSLPLQPGAHDDAPPPPGRAWLLAARPDEGWWVQRRLERLGWQAEVVVGLEATLALAAAAPAPDLLLFSPLRVVPAAGDLRRLRLALPHTRINLFIRPNWADLALEAEAEAQGVGRSVLPLSPRTLAALLCEARAGETASLPRDGPSGADVLLVEDNETNRIIGQHLLALLGLRVRCVVDGAQSLQACLQRAPDLVVMDVRMPVMDGLEATRRLRALQREGRLPPFPVVGLSAHALDADRDAALVAGMDDYLTKPVDVERLREAVRRWVPGRAPAERDNGAR